MKYLVTLIALIFFAGCAEAGQRWVKQCNGKTCKMVLVNDGQFPRGANPTPPEKMKAAKSFSVLTWSLERELINHYTNNGKQLIDEGRLLVNGVPPKNVQVLLSYGDKISVNYRFDRVHDDWRHWTVDKKPCPIGGNCTIDGKGPCNCSVAYNCGCKQQTAKQQPAKQQRKYLRFWLNN